MAHRSGKYGTIAAGFEFLHSLYWLLPFMVMIG